MTVNFAAKTVTFGNPMSLNNTENHGSDRSWTLSVIQSFDENPQTAVVALLESRISTGRTNAGGYAIDQNNNITRINPHNYGSAYPNTLSNVASAGGLRVLTVTSGTGNTFGATLLDYSGAAVAQIHQIPLSAVAAAPTVSIGLFTCDKANGRCVWLYRQGAAVFALPLTVTGNTVTAGAVQTVAGVSGEPPAAPTVLYSPAGTDRFSQPAARHNRIILVSNTSGSANINAGPLRMQILSADASGIVTAGALNTLPLMDTPGSGNIAGQVSVAYADASGIVITGIDFEISPRDGCLLDCTINGTALVSVRKYRPFRNLRVTASTINNFFRTNALQNPADPGEYLFMQQWDGSGGVPLNGLIFWFGNRDDNQAPNHVIGVALEDTAAGRVRVQAAPKYLPGMFSGLIPGRYYAPDINGLLRIVPLTHPANMTPVGIAVTPADLLFFGATGL
jgi:hypothetical protein